ncbi:MAG: LysR family transcriptional regulator [Firmicutes bacterium]|nr:LysR family transcriptional regulator [Bacillota bacterium]
MDIKYLDAFVNVVDLKSFTLAATRLGISQPGISKQVQRLEAELGTRLIARSDGELLLTEAGQLTYQTARMLLAQWESLQGQCALLSQDVSGRVIIGASTIPGKHYLPAILKRLQVLYPHVHVEVQLDDSEAVLTAVHAGRVDIGLVGAQPESPDLLYWRIGSDQLVIVGSPDLEEGVDWRRLPFVLREPGSGTRRAAETGLREVGVLPESLSCFLQTNDTDLILTLVKTGLGLAILSNQDTSLPLESGDLKLVEVLPAHRDFYAVQRRDSAHPLREAMVDCINAALMTRE